MAMMPDPSLDSFFFWNSGSEAVEAAIKVARSKTRRSNIIVMQGAYHGGSPAQVLTLADGRPDIRCCGAYTLENVLLQGYWAVNGMSRLRGAR
jgi:glutamate-1-semialdehyde aminotransferase